MPLPALALDAHDDGVDLELALGVFAAVLGVLSLLRDVLDWKPFSKPRVAEGDGRPPDPASASPASAPAPPPVTPAMSSPQGAPAGQEKVLGVGSWVALVVQGLFVLMAADIAVGLGWIQITTPGGRTSTAGGLWLLELLLLALSLAFGAVGLYLRSKGVRGGLISDRAYVYLWAGGIGLAVAVLLPVLRAGDMF
ncbi:hypothetical protein HCN51_46765 [Nonomuraea sp. FMUSA5-5]|uniref:Uncharacterized protein n=1 Tax=Nonomuraea composti TaxID=2720023 RepID=A0ABX1BGF2_9ACTN|nr:hypothetical protein [Nonomuraea sp. FMUSA5-5]NJP96849.1 hypothetical protein [Nonomuraea sp. FMUSA5-5]